MGPNRAASAETPSNTSSFARVTGFAEIESAILEHFDSAASLWVIDHEFGKLATAVDGSSVQELAGDLRLAMLRGEPHELDDSRWTPFPERGQTIFVVKHHAVSNVSDEDRAAIGLMLGHLRGRFEDAELQRRRKDMAVAAEMQWDTLPVRADTLGGFEVAGVLEPAYEVAGDVFDYAMVDDTLWTYSFDGMGHGLDATISGVLVLAAIRNSRRRGETLVEQMTAANEVVFDQYGGDRFVTGAACRIDREGHVSVVNAGHEPLRVIAGGTVRRMDLAVDLPLGVKRSSTYNEQPLVVLRPGDGLAMFSDGPACQAREGEIFGSTRLDQALERQWSTTPLEAGQEVVDEVLRFLGGEEVSDDVTAVIVRRRDGEAVTE